MEQEIAIVDVRTPEEFFSGHVAGSMNIPLNEVQQRIHEIGSLGNHIIVCCASGGRSGVAAQILKSENILCTNGGAWFDVNNQLIEIK